MLRQRLITAIILAPTLTYVIYRGGWLYGALVLGLLSIGTWEFMRLALASGVLPARWLVLAGVWALALGTLWERGYWLGAASAALLVAATAWHAWLYEQGAAHPLQDWAVTIAVPLYLGVLGGYLLALRALPDGLWWTLTILPAVWIADGGAYMVGRLLAACALTCMGGEIQGKLFPRNADEIERGRAAGYDTSRILHTEDLVRSDNCFFAVTGITDGELLPGVKYFGQGARTHSLVMRSKSGTVREITATHRLDKLMKFSEVKYA